MPVHIAIPEPTSTDTAYNQRSLPPYLAALHSAGAVPVVIPLHERQDRVARILQSVQGILLPGSGYDVNPESYGEQRIPQCGDADPARAAVDELLLQDAFNLHKPILGICYGAQALNVWLNGSLIQDLQTCVDHTPGRTVLDAHPVDVATGSRLATLLPVGDRSPQVNSSHHQAVGKIGDNLRICAVSPRDGVVEAIELESESQFVLGVQWHPERTYTHSELSRAIFAALTEAAHIWVPRTVEAAAHPS